MMLQAGKRWFTGIDGRIFALMTGRDLCMLSVNDRMRHCLIVQKWWDATPVNQDVRWCVMTREFWTAMRYEARKRRWRLIHGRMFFKLNGVLRWLS